MLLALMRGVYYLNNVYSSLSLINISSKIFEDLFIRPHLLKKPIKGAREKVLLGISLNGLETLRRGGSRKSLFVEDKSSAELDLL